MKIRTDFVTNSSSSSFTCYDIKSKELAEYLQSIEGEGYIYNVYIRDNYVYVQADGGYGESSVEDVESFYYDTMESLGYDEEEMAEVYGSWEEHCEEWSKKGSELSSYEIGDIITYITYDGEPKEVTERLTELLKNAENIEYESASFTSD